MAHHVGEIGAHREAANTIRSENLFVRLRGPFARTRSREPCFLNRQEVYYMEAARLKNFEEDGE